MIIYDLKSYQPLDKRQCKSIAWDNSKLLICDNKRTDFLGYIFSAVISVKNKFQMKKNEVKTTKRKMQSKMDDEIQNQLILLGLSPDGDKLHSDNDNDAKVQMTEK